MSEQLEYVPAHFKVIRHIRPKLACVSCQSIFRATAPSRPIARGVAGPGLLAHVMVAKHCDHRPAGSTEPPAAWYQYTPDRKGERPQQHLRDCRGVLQADAYGGWGKLYASGQITEMACRAHARRPWWDLYPSTGKAEDSIAAQALRRIAALSAVEKDIRDQPRDFRCAQRQARAGPLLDEMHACSAAWSGVSRRSPSWREPSATA